MTKWQKFLGALVVLLAGAILGGPHLLEAAGHIGTSNVNGELRTREITFRYLAALLTSEKTAGARGVVGAPSLASVTTLDASTGFEPPPFPCKLKMRPMDVTTLGTVTCTGKVTLWGRNQFGEAISEDITTDLTETTTVTTEKVYEKLTRIKAETCSGGATNDVLRIWCANEIGLPYKIKDADAVISVCVSDDDASFISYCGEGDDVSEDLDLQYESLDIESIDTSDIPSWPTDDAADIVTIRVRPPAGAVN